ncbi:MAG: RidA family protein [Candidatus Binatia bacterium]
MAKRTIVSTDKAPKPVGTYSQAVRASGELMFIAGAVAIDNDGKLVGAGDFKAQMRQVFENIGGVLAGAGASFSDVVEFTTYLVSRDSFPAFLEVRNEIFPKLFPAGDYPANTLLIVSGLARPEWLIEVKAVAVVG